MGSAAGPAGAALSLASIGMNYMGDNAKAEGDAAATGYKADIAARNAKYGRVAADQASAGLSEKLNQTLDHIDVVRAAAHTDPSSPTGAAVRDRAEYLGNRDMDIRVGNIRRQAEQSEDDAAYLRQAGAYALGVGKMGATAKLLGGLGQGLAGGKFGLGADGGGGSSSDRMGFASPSARE